VTENILVPISDEQAKAIQEALKTLQGLGGFLKDTLGTVPSDIVGLLGGDYLKVRRAENLSRVFEKAKERLEQSGNKKAVAPSLSLLLPIVAAAADEDRDELQDIWAALLATAADPNRTKAFRLKFIEIAKELDPLDAGVLREILGAGGQTGEAMRGSAIAKFGVTADEVQISIQNLVAVELLAAPNATPLLAPLGREFLKATR
jgi:Abortive infection alpha